jgi:hypothetical protein
VDGAQAARTLFFVLRPLVLPGIATTVLYAFLPWPPGRQRLARCSPRWPSRKLQPTYVDI